MKIQNLFNVGIIDKDSQGRFVAEGKLIDAENFFVNTLEGSGGGVAKNALGNALKTDYKIVGGKTIGHGKNTSNNKVYNFVKGRDYDYIIEYDSEANNPNPVIVAQSTSNSLAPSNPRLNFKTGERITNVEVIQGNTEKDILLQFSGDSNPPRILNIAYFKAQYLALGMGINWFTAEEIMLCKSPPLYPPTVVQVNSVAAKENFLKDKFVSFATRYKYRDDYYSAISSWQEYAFTPDRFRLDFSSSENKGMENIFNACDITFETGGREVVAIDLLFKYSNSTTVYKVDQFVKADELWADNITIPTPIQFSNSKVFSILPEDQYSRSYDNVPESVVAGTYAGNRAMYANYKEGKDLIDKNGADVVMKYTVGVKSVASQLAVVPVTKLAPTSIFEPSSVVDGKIRLDFTGTSLVKGASVSILFNIKSKDISTAIPGRPISTFSKSYFTILDKDYANIGAVILDDASNGFKSGMEGIISDLFKSTLILPAYTVDFPPSVFNGFAVTVINANVIDITLPSIKYEIVAPGASYFFLEYYQESATTAYVDTIGNKKSMKSHRSYEVAALYKDAQGRKTTGLTSKKNTIFVPLSASASKNTLTVDMSTTKPPAWATTYKFAIKETIASYEEIYVVDFYEDGNFRWVRLEGTTKNKVKEGDTLLVKTNSETVLTKPITVKVLEIKNQEANFIDGSIVELSGMYMKIKPEGFSMEYNPDAYKEYTAFAGTKNGVPTVGIDIPKITTPASSSAIPEGSVLSITLKSNYHNEKEFNEYAEKQFVATSDYPNIKAFYDAQLSTVVFKGINDGDSGIEYGGVFQVLAPSPNAITVRGTSDGNGFNERGFLDVKITLRTTEGFMIFEKPDQEIDTGIFYETPDVFPIVNGDHLSNGTNVVAGVHSLVKTFNCYSHGNGAESYQIRDAFNEKNLKLDYLPIGVSTDKYKQINRFADITYSGIYNSNTNVNRLNEFNLALANFKEDIDKSYGEIVKLKGTDSNLEVYQEDKCSKVYYGKDLLFNADGTSNLTKIEDVLGQQEMYGGEYGISYHAESFDEYAFNSYLTDTKRGIVLKKSYNGLFEISSQGMNSYFKKLFRDNVINQIIGEYDQHHDVYVLNIKMNNNVDDYVTWVYSDKDNGWLGRIKFNPEDMCRINGRFLAFKDGEIWEHNQATGRNTFFGVEYPSTFTINFPQEPSMRKNYKTMEIEGTDAWDLTINTDLDSGYVKAVDFNKEEGVYKAHTRLSDDVIDTSLLSIQGIGNCTVSGLVLSFGFNLSNDISIGDTIRNLSNLLVGTITAKTATTLTLNAVANIVSGDYVMCSKPQSANVNSLTGYHLQVSGRLTKNTKTELFAVNAEVVKSFN